jgi:hypothetical protein
MRTSLNHQPEAQHPKSPAIHKLAGRLPHLPNRCLAATDEEGQEEAFSGFKLPLWKPG